MIKKMTMDEINAALEKAKKRAAPPQKTGAEKSPKKTMPSVQVTPPSPTLREKHSTFQKFANSFWAKLAATALVLWGAVTLANRHKEDKEEQSLQVTYDVHMGQVPVPPKGAVVQVVDEDDFAQVEYYSNNPMETYRAVHRNTRAVMGEATEALDAATRGAYAVADLADAIGSVENAKYRTAAQRERLKRQKETDKARTEIEKARAERAKILNAQTMQNMRLKEQREKEKKVEKARQEARNRAEKIAKQQETARKQAQKAAETLAKKREAERRKAEREREKYAKLVRRGASSSSKCR